ncbi:MAG: hypothetical protein NTZ94_05130 [Verrucomicrobia bacterium]|nr:hypothetical protein [Verrucomicrobiota bacterium]
MNHSTPAQPRATRQRHPASSWDKLRLAFIVLDREELREWLTRHNRRSPRA